jgi:hypothetical protein
MREISVGLNLTAGVQTTVYTVPTGYYAKWNLSHITNSSTSSKHITLVWRDVSASTDIYILDAYTISTKDFKELDGSAYFVLEEGDTVKATSEAGSTISIICTFEQIKKEGI